MNDNPSTPSKYVKFDHSIFSPVTVSVSPVSKSPQVGNLTGNVRQVRDNAADLHNLVNRWNKCLVEGASLVDKAIQLKLSTSSKDKKNVYPPGLSDVCDSLDLLCCEMSNSVMLMKRCIEELYGIDKLETLRGTSDTPMFSTWPSEIFGEVVDEICEAYCKELELKIFVKDNIAHLSEESDLIFYRTSWVLEPYISSNVRLALAAILKETGHI
ncbi:cyclin-dependent kinase 2-interacting protein [Nilaparvata lugens]|uniref:cyclin-dependent kinase 2-interacting protein n=1 Tax=Nilaparvata lugens TaxID=108931 RepID=UPI000B990262|nr:cyclin-dependent kinase 2-interacting protein [Nilaparvata lugens]